MVSMFTLNRDFDHTKSYILDTVATGRWKRPIMHHVDITSLDATQPQPKYVPFQTFLDQNVAVPAADDNRLEKDVDEATRLTHLSRQLARGVELLFHDISGDNLLACVPKHVQENGKFWVDTKVTYGALRGFVTNLTRDTLQKACDVTKILVIRHSNTLAFRKAMRDNSEDARIGFFGSVLTEDMILFLFSSQFKAVSFKFIMHKGVRPDQAEEAIRFRVRMHIKFVAASLIYSTYRNRIQMNHHDKDYKPDEEPGLNETILMDYKSAVSDGPLEYVPKILGTLPANPEFLSSKQDRKLKKEHVKPVHEAHTNWAGLLGV
ncbi:hypothetical protein V494_04032 [Pseudogymnoascus sp. VKM F-4513 (FW-928)]|nr:hypothetical protein V494_04032 [Pseudogymnoascus sp. VKM F-4513 (FW-928)]